MLQGKIWLKIKLIYVLYLPGISGISRHEANGLGRASPDHGIPWPSRNLYVKLSADERQDITNIGVNDIRNEHQRAIPGFDLQNSKHILLRLPDTWQTTSISAAGKVLHNKNVK